MTIKYVEANGVKFAYHEHGEATAPTVMLLHGFPDIATTWSHQIPALLAQGYRAVSYTHLTLPTKRIV